MQIASRYKMVKGPTFKSNIFLKLTIDTYITPRQDK